MRSSGPQIIHTAPKARSRQRRLLPSPASVLTENFDLVLFILTESTFKSSQFFCVFGQKDNTAY